MYFFFVRKVLQLLARVFHLQRVVDKACLLIKMEIAVIRYRTASLTDLKCERNLSVFVQILVVNEKDFIVFLCSVSFRLSVRYFCGSLPSVGVSCS